MAGTGIEFGVLGSRGSLGDRGPTSRLDLAVETERLGFHSLWFGDQALPVPGRASPLLVAAAVGARTTRLRLGFSVLLPIRADVQALAAALTTLDQLSGGRVELGVGWPGDDAEPDLAAMDRALDGLLGGWRRGAQTATASAGHRGPGSPLVAPPDEASVAWAAGRGFGLVLPAVLSWRSVDRCLAAFTAAGGTTSQVVLERFCLVGESDSIAEGLATPILTTLSGAPTQLAGR